MTKGDRIVVTAELARDKRGTVTSVERGGDVCVRIDGSTAELFFKKNELRELSLIERVGDLDDRPRS